MSDPIVYGPFISRKQAKTQGLKHYFTGKPCKHGHVSTRYVNGSGDCTSCAQQRAQKRYEAKGEEIKQANRESYSINRDHINELKRAGWWRNRERNLAKARQWKKDNPGKVNAYQAVQYRDNPQHRIKVTLRNSVNERVAEQGGRKSARAFTLVGCSSAELCLHLESLFLDGMNWSNHSLAGWHIDHIRPCASFDLTDPEQQKQCFHYTNLQPLWAKDNLAKSDNWDEPMAA